MFQLFLRRVRGSVCRISAVIAILTSISLTFTSILFTSVPVLADDPVDPHVSVLYGIAQDTWKFYATDLDPNTHLPMDNLTWAGGGPLSGKGQYTSASNIGVYLWAVVAANDLKLISRSTARSLVSATLDEVATIDRYQGLLYQWYDTTNGHRIRNPFDIDCAAEPTPKPDNCYFLSAVDNGWYASGSSWFARRCRS